MFDQAFTYEEDTEVVDVDDAPIARSRVPTEDLAVHVLVDGHYHRRHPSLAKTSCGIPYHSQFAPVRREMMVHPLAPRTVCQCFTDDEIAEADGIALAEKEGAL